MAYKILKSREIVGGKILEVECFRCNAKLPVFGKRVELVSLCHRCCTLKADLGKHIGSFQIPLPPRDDAEMTMADNMIKVKIANGIYFVDTGLHCSQHRSYNFSSTCSAGFKFSSLVCSSVEGAMSTGQHKPKLANSVVPMELQCRVLH
ncbi:hypothetical protein RJT34_00986 [Clitoria ternatea]|uniref:Uncharacterized protein n=1 Tax=Clitoria ternatea TaxID=43366 RepID=A0AAN9KFT8_CLITE